MPALGKRRTDDSHLPVGQACKVPEPQRCVVQQALGRRHERPLPRRLLGLVLAPQRDVKQLAGGRETLWGMVTQYASKQAAVAARLGRKDACSSCTWQARFRQSSL